MSHLLWYLGRITCGVICISMQRINSSGHWCCVSHSFCDVTLSEWAVSDLIWIRKIWQLEKAGSKDSCIDGLLLISKFMSPWEAQCRIKMQWLTSRHFVTIQHMQWKASKTVRTVISYVSLSSLLTSDHLECCCIAAAISCNKPEQH
jgi:hypothetical protein